MAPNSPPTKRRRVSSGANSVVIVALGELPALATLAGQEKFTRHADFWLDDGNIILLAGVTAFRVYKDLLAKNSAVFADMLDAGSADATELFDGCPVVRLSDNPEDLRDFLQYLMPCAKIRLHNGLPIYDFSELYAIIHLAHKYQCLGVENRALSILKQFYTASFSEYVKLDPYEASMACPPHHGAIAAINIARLTGTPSMLPLAFYEVFTLEAAVLDGYTRRDGSVEYLTTDDLRLCLSARKELMKQLVVYINETFDPLPYYWCETNAKCTAALNNMRRDAEQDWLGDCDVFDVDGEGYVGTLAKRFSLCQECTEQVVKQEETERKRFWRMLPGVFGMTGEECGFTD